MPTAPSTDDARQTVEQFIAAVLNKDAATAITYVVPVDDPSWNFEIDAFPLGGGVDIGEPEADTTHVIVPCSIIDAEPGGPDAFPAVCVQTPDGCRIDLMASASKAMGADISEMMNMMTEGMEAMAAGMGQMMNGIADGLASAFDSDDESTPSQDDVQGAFEDMVQDHEEIIFPAIGRQIEAFMGHSVDLEVDWSGTGNAEQALYLGTVGVGSLVSALCVLIGHETFGRVLPGSVLRISAEWDDDATSEAVTLNPGQNLTLTVGPFLETRPVNPVNVAEQLVTLLELA